MLKLGKRWSVQRQVDGTTRSPADVAEELEHRMIREAQSILQKRCSGTLQTMLAMTARRAAEPQTETTGPCVTAISDASDAKRRNIIVHITSDFECFSLAQQMITGPCTN